MRVSTKSSTTSPKPAACWPFIPATCEKIYAQLGLKGAPEKFSEATWGRLTAGHAIGEPAALFPRKDLAPK